MNGRTLLIMAGVAAPLVYLGLSKSGGSDDSTATSGHSIAAARASVPPIPGKVIPRPPGIMYMGNDDAAHVAFVRTRLEALANEAPEQARQRGIRAFAALQGREGSTASINSYDNQIVTWGTGWGGLGLLPNVFERLKGTKTAARLASAGLRYLGNREYEVVDEAGNSVRGTAPALKVIQSTPSLVALLVDVARSPATRAEVLDAQLNTFLAFGGKVAGQEQAATQALFNFAAHLQHWAPGFGNGALSWAASQVPGPPSRVRDVALAEKMLYYFYDRARKTKWIPSWPQAKGYWNDMVSDGLTEAKGHPILARTTPPGMDNVGAWGPDARGDSVFALVSAVSDGHGKMLKAMANAAPDKPAFGQLMTWALHKFGPTSLRTGTEEAVNWLAFLSAPWFGLDMKSWAEWQQGLANFVSEYADSSIGQYTETTFNKAEGYRRSFNEWAAKLRANGLDVADVPPVELAPLAPAKADIEEIVDVASAGARRVALPVALGAGAVVALVALRRAR